MDEHAAAKHLGDTIGQQPTAELERLRTILREIAVLAGEDYDDAMAADDPATMAVAAVKMLRDDFAALLEDVSVIPESLPDARRRRRLHSMPPRGRS